MFRKIVYWGVLAVIAGYSLALAWALYQSHALETEGITIVLIGGTMLVAGIAYWFRKYLPRKHGTDYGNTVLGEVYMSVATGLGVLILSTFSTIVFDGTVIIRNGVAEVGQAFINPFTVEQCYQYPDEYYLNFTEEVNGNPTKLRVYAHRYQDDPMYYYTRYGTPEAVEDSLRQAATDALRLIQHAPPLLHNDLEIIAAARASVRMLPGYDPLRILLQNDSVAFNIK